MIVGELKKHPQRRHGKAIAAASQKSHGPFQSPQLVREFLERDRFLRVTAREPDEILALRALCAVARDNLGRFDRSIVTRSAEAIVSAELGRSAKHLDLARSDLYPTSLAVMWSALTRPVGSDERGQAQPGVEWLSRGPLGTDHRTAPIVERVRRARVLFGPVVAMNNDRLKLVVRDSLDEREYIVVTDKHDVKSLTRWSVALALIVPVDAERWIYPSIISALHPSCAPSAQQMLASMREILPLTDERGDEPAFDPAMSAEERTNAAQTFLLRHLGITHGTFVRLGRQLEAASTKKRFPVTSDGDKAKPTSVVFDLRAPPLFVARAITGMPDVRRTSPTSWIWISAGAGLSPDNTLECTAKLSAADAPPDPGFESRWTLRALSRQRIERTLEKLHSLLGEAPVLREHSAEDLSKDNDTLASERGPDVQELVLAEWLPPEGSPTSTRIARPLDRMRGMLDRDIRAVGGKPRELAKTEEGRASVEKWLREAETIGDPNRDADARWVDLDPLREELGLPVVRPAR